MGKIFLANFDSYPQAELVSNRDSLMHNHSDLFMMRMKDAALIDALVKAFFEKKCYEPKIKAIIAIINAGSAGNAEIETMSKLIAMLSMFFKFSKPEVMLEKQALIDYLSLVYAYLNVRQSNLHTLDDMNNLSIVLDVVDHLCKHLQIETQYVRRTASNHIVPLHAFGNMPADIIAAMPIKPGSLIEGGLMLVLANGQQGSGFTETRFTGAPAAEVVQPTKGTQLQRQRQNTGPGF